MILEESNDSILSAPFVAPRDLGWQGVIVDGTRDAPQRLDYITDALDRTPTSIRALEAWSDRVSSTASKKGKRGRMQFFSAYPNSTAVKEALVRCGGEGASLSSSSWGGLYTGNSHLYVINRDAPTISHEYGHFIDYQLGRIQPAYASAWTGIEGDKVTSRPEWMDLIGECFAGIEAQRDTGAYGYTNYVEWFAEMYAGQLHPQYTGGKVGFSTMFTVLCGRNLELAGHVRGMFKQLIPDLPAFPWRNSFTDAQRLLPCISGLRMNGLRTGVFFSRTYEKEVAEAVTWTISAGTLPAGLTMSNGTISGTPTTPGAFDFTLTVSNANGSMDRRFQGSISDASVPTPVITTFATLPRVFSGEPWSATLQATGGPVVWSLTRAPSIPIALSSDGVVTITNTSTFTGGKFTARATNAGGFVDKEFEIPYSIRARWFSTALPALRVGQAPAPNTSLGAQGSWPLSITLTAGAVPDGMYLEINNPTYDAYVRGVPTTAGDYSFELTVENDWGAATRTFSGTVQPRVA